MTGIDFRETVTQIALRRHDYIDNWFPVRYSLNPYSGCEYDCLYCRVNWKLTKTVIVKKKFLEILSKELHQIQNPQMIGMGGGFNDIFSPIEQKKRISEQVIMKLLETGHRPLLMTKNPGYVLKLVKDWLPFPKKQRPILITSISSPISQRIAYEFRAPSPKERLVALRELAHYLDVGVALLPWMGKASTASKDFTSLLLEGKKLKWGFSLLGFLQGNPPRLKKSIIDDLPTLREKREINKLHFKISQAHQIWPRLPPSLFAGYLSPKDELTVFFAYCYYLGEKEKKNAFRLASLGINSLSEIEFQKRYLSDQLERITGVGPVISKIIKDFLRYRREDYFTNYWEKLGYYDKN